MTRSKDKDEPTLLSPFEAVFRDVLDTYGQTRNQIFKLEKWDYQSVFDPVIKSRFAGDASGGKWAIPGFTWEFPGAREQSVRPLVFSSDTC